MSCIITYNNQEISEKEFIEKNIPHQGDIIEYDGIEYMVHDSDKVGSQFLNEEFLSEESYDVGDEARAAANQIPFYNLDPVGKGTVEFGGISPIFNISLLALLKNGFTKTGKTFDYEKYKNAFGKNSSDEF